MNLFGFFSKQVERQYLCYKESQWYDARQLKEIQAEKLNTLLRHTAANVPFYQTIINKTNLSNETSIDYLMNVPVMTRAMLQNHLHALISDNVPASSRRLHSSGGTTGQPVAYYLDNRLKTICRAIEGRGDYEWTSTNPKARKALLWGRVNANDRYVSFLRGFLNRQWKYYLYRATEKDVGKVISQIKIIRPKLILGYASFIARVAQYLLNKEITISHPLTVISTAEILTEEIKEMAERAYGCRVYNRYASGEFGLIASECSAGNMHIHSERIFFEVFKEGKPVKPGTEGEIVITDLDNYAFPFIRYATGDIGCISDVSCSCGRGLPVLKRLLGRTADYIQTPQNIPVLASETFTAFRVVCAKQEVKQVQIVQPGLDTIIARVVRGNNYTKEMEAQIRKLLFHLCFSGTGIQYIDFEYVEQLETASSGKTPFYISKLSQRLRC